MEGKEELAKTLSSGARVVVVAQRDLDLRPGAPDNRIFLLKISEGSLAAGGRGGGFGERRVVTVSLFSLDGGIWKKAFEASEEPEVSNFEVPYYVSRMPFFNEDGTEAMGYGVVDPDLVKQMSGKAESLSPA